MRLIDKAVEALHSSKAVELHNDCEDVFAWDNEYSTPLGDVFTTIRERYELREDMNCDDCWPAYVHALEQIIWNGDCEKGSLMHDTLTYAVMGISEAAFKAGRDYQRKFGDD